MRIKAAQKQSSDGSKNTTEIPGIEWTLAELYRLAASWIIDVSERNSEHRRWLSRSQTGLGRLSHHLLFDESLPRYVFFAEELNRELEGDEADAIVESRFVTRWTGSASGSPSPHATFTEYS